MTPIARSALMLAWLAASAAVAAPAIPLRNAEPAFQQFIASLKDAATRKDAATIHALVATDYTIERDFGGTFDPVAPAIENFGMDFQFDNARLNAEHQGHGWREFSRMIAGTRFEKKADGRMCVPHGALATKPFPRSQLCFRKNSEGWRIQGIIRGGD